jgi:hypothetical protein
MFVIYVGDTWYHVLKAIMRIEHRGKVLICIVLDESL